VERYREQFLLEWLSKDLESGFKKVVSHAVNGEYLISLYSFSKWMLASCMNIIFL
jgi:hypothetical protein